MAAIALTSMVSNTALAHGVSLDPDGAGPRGPMEVSTFDWTVGNAISIDGVPDPGGAPKVITTLSHGVLGSFLHGGATVSGTGLNQDYEITYVSGFRETITPVSPTVAVFSEGSGGPNYFEIYYDESRDSNEITGAGFSNGTLILSGTVVAASGVFDITGFFFPPTNGIPVPLDQFGGDDYPGLLTVTGVGGVSITVRADTFDSSFFPELAPGTLSLPFNSTQNLPFRQTNPSASFVSGPQTAGHPVITPNLGIFNGSGPDVMLQSDPNMTFLVAEIVPAINIEKATNGVDADLPTGPFIPVTDPVSWTYVVTNTGSEDLISVSVTDDRGVAVSCPQSSLMVGASMTCTASGVALIGQYANIGSVTGDGVTTGTTVTDEDPSHYFGVAPEITIEKATNGIDADNPTGPFIGVGGAVNWTYLVTNTGNEALSGVSVVDNQGVTVSCPQTTLAVDAFMTCTSSGTAVAGQYANIGSTTGTGTTSGIVVNDDDPSHYFGAAPVIDIEKSTNGFDADVPTGPVLTVGDAVVWTYLVTNIGNEALLNVGVTDNQGVAVICPQTTLAIAESMTCNAAGTAQLGQYANIGSTAGTGTGSGIVVTDTDPSHYFANPLPVPAIDIEKATNGFDADLPTGPFVSIGGMVTWTYVVTNTGNETLNSVTVTDDVIGVIACPQGTLIVGASMTCTATGTAIAGQYENFGNASGIGAVSAVPVSDIDPSHYFGATPLINIEKATNGEDADTPTGPVIPVGSLVTWTYLVSNTGGENLVNVVVADDQGVSVICPKTTLSIGESMACVASGAAQIGQYANIGSVSGEGAVSGTPVTDDDPSHYIGTTPLVSIEKATNGEDADLPTGPIIQIGDPVNWTYLVTNTGSEDLTNVAVSDDQGVIVTCPATVLAAGANMTCTASGTAQLGQYANIGSVAGEGTLSGTVVTDDDPSHYFGPPAPAIDIEKATNGEDADMPTGPIVQIGDPVTWTYVVTNTGNEDLILVVVTDDQGAFPICPRTTLAVGESFTCTASGVAQAGQYANIGAVTGQGTGSGTVVNDADPSHYFAPAEPAIDIEKATNGVDADLPIGPIVQIGDPVNWTYVVTNIGSEDIVNVVVSDDQGVTVSCPGIALALGEAMTCTASGVAQAGQYANIGTVTGQGSGSGTPVTDADPSHYFAPTVPAINIEKATNGVDADTPTGPNILVGDPVLWTYVVTNTGSEDLINAVVVDNQGVSVSCPQTTLSIGESMTCTASGSAELGQYSNIGTSTGDGATSGTPVTDDDPSHYFGVETPIGIPTLSEWMLGLLSMMMLLLGFGMWRKVT